MLRFRFIKIHQPESKLRKIYAEPSQEVELDNGQFILRDAWNPAPLNY